MKKNVLVILLYCLMIGIKLQAQQNQIVLYVGGAMWDNDTIAKKCLNGQFLPVCKGANTFSDLASMKMSSVTIKVYAATKLVGTVEVQFPVPADKNAKVKELVDQIKDKGYIYYEKPIVEMIKKTGEKELRPINGVNIFIDEKLGGNCKPK